MGRIILGAFLLLAAPIAFANSLTGKVVKITDGDTLYVLDANYKEHKIRLAGIDAPERKQAYGLASRKHLASIVASKQVTIEYKKGIPGQNEVGPGLALGSGPATARRDIPRPSSLDTHLGSSTLSYSPKIPPSYRRRMNGYTYTRRSK